MRQLIKEFRNRWRAINAEPVFRALKDMDALLWSYVACRLMASPQHMANAYVQLAVALGGLVMALAGFWVILRWSAWELLRAIWTHP